MIEEASANDLRALYETNILGALAVIQAALPLLRKQGGGHILFRESPIVTEGGVVEALSLAPLAVIPLRQRLGIGSMRVREGLRACTEAGHRIVVVLGHPNFYRRFGFSTELAKQLESPYAGETFMAVELVGGALEGIRGRAEYPPPFGRL